MRTEDDRDIYTKEEWKDCVRRGLFVPYDGSGIWLKSDLTPLTGMLFDNVFSEPPPEGATHIEWFNK